MLMTNIVFHSMEMKYILGNSLNLNIGEIGPVEVELIVTIMYISLGYFAGPEFL